MVHETRRDGRQGEQGDGGSDTADLDVDVLVTGDGSIQAAVDDAQPGDVVGVVGGTFTEQVVLDTRVTLVGLGPQRPTVRTPRAPSPRLDWNGDPVAPVVAAEADGLTVRRLRVESGHRSVGSKTTAGIGVDDAGIRLEDVSVVDAHIDAAERTRHDVGVLVTNTDGFRRLSTVTNCDVRGYQHSGIVGAGSGLTFRVTETTVAGLATTGTNRQHGIRLSSLDKATLLGNTVADNYYRHSSVSTGVLAVSVSDAFVAWNDIEGNNNGIVAQNTGDIAARRNNIRVNDTGALNLGASIFDATNNWWGAPDGPSPSEIRPNGEENSPSGQPPDGSGDAAFGVVWNPFADRPVDTAVWSRIQSGT
jgi:hypothetical protein